MAFRLGEKLLFWKIGVALAIAGRLETTVAEATEKLFPAPEQVRAESS